MPSSAGSYARKLERADHHLEGLRQLIAPERHESFLREDRQPPTGPGVVAITVAPIPEEVPALIGDVLQNLRSTLDHLAYALTLAHTPNAKEGTLAQVEFPICRRKPSSRPNIDRWRSKIGSVDRAAEVVIEGLQPYVLGPRDYVNDALWLLNELARFDRHRTIGLVTYVPIDVGAHVIAVDYGEFSILQSDFGVLEPGAVILRGRINPHGPEDLVKVKVNPAAQIVFADGPCIERNAWETLRDIRTHIANNVIPSLLPFL